MELALTDEMKRLRNTHLEERAALDKPTERHERDWQEHKARTRVLWAAHKQEFPTPSRRIEFEDAARKPVPRPIQSVRDILTGYGQVTVSYGQGAVDLKRPVQPGAAAPTIAVKPQEISTPQDKQRVIRGFELLVEHMKYAPGPGGKVPPHQQEKEQQTRQALEAHLATFDQTPAPAVEPEIHAIHGTDLTPTDPESHAWQQEEDRSEYPDLGWAASEESQSHKYPDLSWSPSDEPEREEHDQSIGHDL